MAIVLKSRDSLLTTSSGYTNYRGILNLVIILLVLSNARAALENIIKYGILVDPFSWLLFLSEGSKHSPALMIVFLQSAHVFVSFSIEKLLASLFKRELLSLSRAGGNGSADRSCQDTNNNNSGLKTSRLGDAQGAPRASMLMVNAAIALNLLACISIPPFIVYTNDTHPISTSVSLMLVSISFLKLVSYHMMNFWCRDSQRPSESQSRTTRSFLKSYVPPAVDFCKQLKEADSVQAEAQKQQEACNGSQPARSNHLCQQVALETLARYPKNVTLENILRYVTFPTLCYELDYALTERIRKRFLIKRVVELIILSQLDMALIQQWIVPTVSNSVTPFRQMRLSHMLERLLKLAIPNHVIWLIWFYLFFHSLLNIIAELTRFADREFYRDWWNSESVSYFWSNWNIPVHKWCARHLYVPLIALGLSRRQASTAVFFVSAFFHEYLVSVPLKLFRMWAFAGMLVQLPWARFVSAYFNSHFANVAVWVSLIIGQPLCILMYYHDYYVIHNVQKQ